MDAVKTIMRTSHIWAGFALLVLFWLPLIFRKGSRGHVWVGRIYTWLMFGVLFSAAVLCIHRVVTGNWAQGFALGFLTLISFNSLWYGYAIAIKKRLTNSIANARNAMFTIISIYSVALIYVGVHYNQVLFIIFGLLGTLPFIPLALAIARRTVQPEFNWLREHYTNMLISGGAAYTAFFAFGSRIFFTFPDNTLLAVLPWVLPTFFALMGVTWFNRRYVK
jgi:hypothetical protein